MKCIYIDPPYNTGNEGWAYNDNVNSPMHKAWQEKNAPIDGEDMERHDKWLNMMWPRLHLLRELLSDDGVIFVSIDDNEQSHVLQLMNEILGERQFVGTLIYVQNLGALPGRWMTQVTEYIHVFAKDFNSLQLSRLQIEQEDDEWEEDDYGPYREGYGLVRAGTSSQRADRPNLFFPIFVGQDLSIGLERQSPADTELLPTHSDGSEAVWRWGKERVAGNTHDLLVKPHKRMGYQLVTKVRPNVGNVFTSKPRSLFYKPQYAAAHGTKIVSEVLGRNRPFDFPKPVALIEDLIRFGTTGPDDIVLDSFAGSGTTAHAVLALNKEDGGSRKFILVECEDYADTITAERVRRVINGVPTAKDTALKEGLGGSFTYMTLGDPLDIDALLTGESLPSFETLAQWLLHTATGLSALPDELRGGASHETGLFYSTDTHNYHLLYNADIEWLRGNDGMLNDEKAHSISRAARDSGKDAVVFGAGKYMGQRDLTDLNITFAQLPFELQSRTITPSRR